MTLFRRRADGFTLIETMVSISIFAIIMVGVTPLIASSLRGSSLARSFTVGKNLAQESLERIRGLPYFESSANRDVLDLYYPNLGAGYSAGPPATFTTTCTATSSTPAPSANQACPPEHADGTSTIPAGYTVEFAAQFVSPNVPTPTPETFSVVTPPSTYSSASAATATPPTQLLRVTVTVRWTNLSARSYRLVTLVGNRKLSRDQVRASGTVDFVAQIITSYQTTAVPPRLSLLRGFAGRTRSQVEVRSFSSAATESNAGEIKLISQDETVTEPLDSALGATAAFRAPPNSTPTSSGGGAQSVEHPDLGLVSVARIEPTTVNEAGLVPPGASSAAPVVEVVNGLPRAITTFGYSVGADTEEFWTDNQADTSSRAVLQLDPLRHMFSIRRAIVGSTRMRGTTYAEATAITPQSTRKVHASATVTAARLLLLPTTFISVGERTVVVVENFTASVECKSTGSGAGGIASGSWSAQIRVWSDPDGPTPGSYVELDNTPTEAGSLVRGSTDAGFTDPLDAFSAANNHIVLDAPADQNDIWLFNDPANARKGYLDSWDSTQLMTSQLTDDSATVSMPQAISIVTSRTDILNPESKMTVQIGKLSCAAVDSR